MSDPIAAFVDMENAFKNVTSGVLGPLIVGASNAIDVAYTNGDDAEISSVLDGLQNAYRDALETKETRIRFLLEMALRMGNLNVSDARNAVYANTAAPQDIMDAVYESFLKITSEAGAKSAVAEVRKVIEALRRAEVSVDSSLVKGASFNASIHKAMSSGTRAVSDIAANLTTSRVINYGALVQLDADGQLVFQLKAKIDGRTSNICKRLHGRIFRVPAALDHLDRVIRITDPEELKAAAPFVSARQEMLVQLETLSPMQLEEKGVMVPPFHPACRTIIVRKGTVDTSVIHYVPISNPYAGVIADTGQLLSAGSL